MKSMRELIETVVSEGKGKGAVVVRNDDATLGKDYDKHYEMPEIVERVAAILGWQKNASPAKGFPFLRGAATTVFHRVFTKSNVEFLLYGEKQNYMIVAAKRCSTPWRAAGRNTNNKDPNAVTYFRIHIDGAFEFDDLAARVRRFSQEYKRVHANSEKDGRIP